MKIRISIGLSSMILIFMVLCMSVFCLLSVSDAKTSLIYAQKRADSVQAYYQADLEAQTFIRDYRELRQNMKDASGTLERLSPIYSEKRLILSTEHGLVSCDLPMVSGQTLHVEFDEDGTNIHSYYTYYSDDYVIDSDLPVWEGNENNRKEQHYGY